MRNAPELQIAKWLNTDKSFQLSECIGKVVVIHAFQMLCPGCIYHGIPQTQKIQKRFTNCEDVIVLGVHTVFEHHAVMTQEALKVFITENRLSFPIGIDSAGEGTCIPKTMAAYDMQGTPTLILLDRKGYIRLQHFGIMEDLDLGIAIGKLIEEV